MNVKYDLTPTTVLEMRPTIGRWMARRLLRLHQVGWPESDASIERIMRLAADARHHLGVLWQDVDIVGMVSLIETESFRRTALLYEELVLSPFVRASAPTLLWALDGAILLYAGEHTRATRIEGTVGEENTALWEIHRRSGFDDRRQKAFVWTVKD